MSLNKHVSMLRPVLLSTALALAIGGSVGWYSSAQAQSQAAAAPAPELVVGLPDFTRLVEQVGPAVVSVEAEVGGKPRTATAQRGQQPQMPDEQQIP